MHDTPARLLRLLSVLTARPTWSGPELAQRLEVTTRTVRRDIERLRSLGYPVEAVSGPGGGYRLGPGGSLPPLLLEDEEAVAVALCLRAGAGGSVAGLEESALAALAKVEQTLPTHLRPRVDALGSVTVSLGRTEPDAVDPATLVALAQACRGSERVVAAYVDRDGNETERRLEPYRLVHTGRRWYLVAHDLDRRDWRTFRVDRIATVRATGHRFTFTDPPDAAALVGAAITTAPYRHQLRVVLAAPAEVIRAKVPPTVVTVEPDGPDRCTVTTGGDDLTVLALHLAALDADFVSIDPPALRDELRRLATRLATV